MKKKEFVNGFLAMISGSVFNLFTVIVLIMIQSVGWMQGKPFNLVSFLVILVFTSIVGAEVFMIYRVYKFRKGVLLVLIFSATNVLISLIVPMLLFPIGSITILIGSSMAYYEKVIEKSKHKDSVCTKT